MSYIFLKKPIQHGMGLVGPDQPWTKENAGKVIGTETRACPAGDYARTMLRSGWYRPVRSLALEAGKGQEGTGVLYNDAFPTGRYLEATKAGQGRKVEWCYNKNEKLCNTGEIEVPDRLDYDIGAEVAPAGCTSEKGGNCRVIPYSPGGVTVQKYSIPSNECRPCEQGRVADSWFYQGKDTKRDLRAPKLWCCPKPSRATSRYMTEDEKRKYTSSLGTCRPFVLQDGTIKDRQLAWVPIYHAISSTGLETGINDGDYRLVCLVPQAPIATNERGDLLMEMPNMKFEVAPITAEIAAQDQAQIEEFARGREEIITSGMEPESPWYIKYGLFLAMAGGVLGIGVVAGVIKSRKLKKNPYRQMCGRSGRK
jgi:hypothetical protein